MNVSYAQIKILAMVIIGTGTASNIKAVKTKLVGAFATLCDLNLDVNTLGDYLKEKLSYHVKV